jgi:hypothetical protein
VGRTVEGVEGADGPVTRLDAVVRAVKHPSA